MIPQSHSGTYIWRKLTWKDTCTPVFTAALFTLSKAWKQPKYAINEWITKMWHIHSGPLLSHKKQQNKAICSNMDGHTDDHTKSSKPEIS